MPDALPSIETPARPSAPTDFGAPLFGRIVETMREGGRWKVLDLGCVRSATLTLLSEFRCHLDIVDLPADLAEIHGHEDDLIQLKQCFTQLMPVNAKHGKTVNIVFCWDLLNYLQRPALATLMRRVVARTQPGALLHALIAYSNPDMPSRPGKIFPCGDDRLVYTPTTAEKCKAPRYSPKELERYMQGFHAHQRRLLNNGMQEYLFKL